MSAPVQTEARSTFERVLARRTDELSRSQAERAVELAQQGAPQRARPRRVTLARVAGVVVAWLFLRLVVCGTPGRRGNEPIGAAAVATADGAGVGASVAAFLPQPPAHAASEPTPTPSPGGAAPAALMAAPPPATRVPASLPQKPAPRSPATPVHAERGAATTAGASTTPADNSSTLFAAADTQDTAAGDVTIGAADAARAPSGSTVINLGARLHAKLEATLRTGSAFAPATATLAEDLREGERVILPAGTRLAGSAFATANDDRVQIVWRALVHDGRTLTIQAETLGPDGGAGLRGKVIRRHRQGVLRRVTSTLASTAGEVAGYAVPLGDTALEQAGAALAGRAGRELGQLGSGREWLQADTVVEVKAGTPLVVYVSADIVLGASGAP